MTVKVGIGVRCEPRPEPELEHRDVISGSVLKEPQRASSGYEKGNPLSDENCDGDSQKGVATSRERGDPQVAQARQFHHACCVVHRSQHSGVAAQRRFAALSHRRDRHTRPKGPQQRPAVAEALHSRDGSAEAANPPRAETGGDGAGCHASRRVINKAAVPKSAADQTTRTTTDRTGER